VTRTISRFILTSRWRWGHLFCDGSPRHSWRHTVSH